MKVECPGCHRHRNVTPFQIKEGVRFCSKLCRFTKDGTLFRLLKKTVVKGPDDCWNYIGSSWPQGYGKLWGKTRMLRAHVFAFEYHNGPIPSGLLVCHSCDNPRCVNPKHLWLGTHKDNSDDCLRKGRHVATLGEDAGTAKLTNDQVREVRQLYASGMYQYVIAKKFGISQSTVSLITTEKRWRHL